jgi:hypothetical protein
MLDTRVVGFLDCWIHGWKAFSALPLPLAYPILSYTTTHVGVFEEG